MSDPKRNLPESSPFSPEERQWLDGFLGRLGADQLTWLEGFLSGLRSAESGGAAAPAMTASAAAPELTVLYGTESGNAESLADQTASAAKQKGFKAKVLNMADIEPVKLKDVANLVVLISTWGEGDPPETAVDFYEKFMGDAAPAFKGTRFSVLGLGDTSYEHFCKMGKDFDTRLEALGGERIFPRKDCDVDFDDDFEAWKTGVLEALGADLNGAATAASAPPAAAAPVAYSRKNPFPSPLKERVLLNGRGSDKETIHLEFDLAGSGLHYEVGDALAVVPQNATEVVDAILQKSGLGGSSPVKLKDGEHSLRYALTSQLDVTALSKPVVTRYNELAESKELAAIIEDKDRLNDYIFGREVIDLLTDYPVKGITGDALVGIMRKLPPRLYSIASSLKAFPEEVHLTVGVVRYNSHGRERLGVCSTHLADRIEVGDTAEVFVTTNKNFRLPSDPDTPIIMVGPGTGIAPFRAYIQERQVTGAKGKNWLIFGDQHYLTDFLYQTEWQGYLADGMLQRFDLAFSRDQKHKIYVQDRMRENAKELYGWLQEGASFYVCGDANKMAHDVDKALHDIVESEGGMNAEAAVDYVKQLKSDKRYLRDVY